MLEPKGTYTDQHQVEFYECDFAERMKLSSLMRVLQQTAENQMNDMGLDYQTMLAKHSMAFLVSRLMLQVGRMPVLGQQLQVSTCPLGTRGAQFFRETDAISGGETLVKLYTSWTLFDPAARKILRPDAFPKAVVNGVLDIDPHELRFATQKGGLAGRRPVRYSDLDPNGHVNNAAYFDIICDMLPLEALRRAAPRRVCLYYDHEALPGQDLCLYQAEANGEYHLMGEQGEHRCFEARVTLG